MCVWVLLYCCSWWFIADGVVSVSVSAGNARWRYVVWMRDLWQRWVVWESMTSCWPLMDMTSSLRHRRLLPLLSGIGYVLLKLNKKLSYRLQFARKLSIQSNNGKLPCLVPFLTCSQILVENRKIHIPVFNVPAGDDFVGISQRWLVLVKTRTGYHMLKKVWWYVEPFWHISRA